MSANLLEASHLPIVHEEKAPILERVASALADSHAGTSSPYMRKDQPRSDLPRQPVPGTGQTLSK